MGLQRYRADTANKQPEGARPVKTLNVFDRHQLKIARDTLKMSDAGTRIMGGMDKETARAVILRITGKSAKE